MDKDPTSFIKRLFGKKSIPAEKLTTAEIEEQPAEILTTAEIELATKAINVALEDVKTNETINKFDNIDAADSATHHLEKYSEEEHRQIAKKLIEYGYYFRITMDMDKFTGVNQKAFAEFLIKIGLGDLVASDLYKFNELNNKDMIMRLMNLGFGSDLGRDIDKLNELDKEVAIKFIKTGNIHWFKNNIEYFTGLDSEVALLLIANKELSCVNNNAKLFSGLNDKVIEALVSDGYWKETGENLKYYSGLSQKSAQILVDSIAAKYVANNPGSFNVKHSILAKILIMAGRGQELLENINKYNSSDHLEIVKMLIKNKKLIDVKDNIEKISNLDEETAIIIIKSGDSGCVLNNLDKFPGLKFDRILPFLKDKYISIGKSAIDGFADKMNVKTGSELVDNSNLAYYSEKKIVKDNERELINESGGLDYKKVYESLIDTYVWKDASNVKGPMERGAEIFGYEKMFSYINRIDVSRHDQLYFFDSVIKMFDRYKKIHSTDNSMTEQKLVNMFFSNILQQVRMDNSVESSYSVLSSISNHIDSSDEGFEKYRKQLTKLKKSGFAQEMEKLEYLLNGGCFESWSNLKNFAELTIMLDRTKIWEKLSILKQRASSSDKAAALYDYISKIMFHKDSTVNISAAEELFMDPKSFLRRSDIHAPREIHDRKKPSNYFDIPNLDLTAQELVEALAIGEIDKIQTFTGMEVSYLVSSPNSESSPTPVVEVIAPAGMSLIDKIIFEIGSRKNSNANPKLFGELSKLLNVNGIKLNPQDINEIEDFLNPEISLQIEKLLNKYPNQINLDRSKIGNNIKGDKYRVKIYDKHDPRAALAGDDTNCCMPFGSGKNNIYTFNPNCGLVTVEVAKKDGNFMTIAQSILTLDQNIDQNVGRLIGDKDDIDLDKIFADVDLSEGDNYIACDNIEIRANYKTDKYREIIAKLYQDFFARYAKVFNQNNLTGRTVNTNKIIIGQGYSDYHFGNQESNTYVPLAPVSYSDKLGEKVDIIILKGQENIPGIEAIDEHITTAEQFEFNEDLPQGVKPLTYQDALIVTHLESKAYKNKTMVEGLSAMENSLIAKDINNADKNRPNMSFKYGNKGYILAYEGKIDDLGGENGIYIEDLAVDPNSQIAGGTLMLTLLDQYKKEYVEKNNILPIFGQMREKTSYELVKNNIARFEKRLGIKLQLEELDTYEVNNETIHKVVIRPIK